MHPAHLLRNTPYYFSAMVIGLAALATNTLLPPVTFCVFFGFRSVSFLLVFFIWCPFLLSFLVVV